MLSVGTVEEWGIQFGQTMEAPAVGKTYTFAVLAKSMKGPATIRLEIERHGSPYDRAVASPPQTVGKEAWTELHVTFKVDKAVSRGMVRLRELRPARRGVSPGHVPPVCG